MVSLVHNFLMAASEVAMVERLHWGNSITTLSEDQREWTSVRLLFILTGRQAPITIT